MKTSPDNRSASAENRAFTKVELLVIIIAVGLLAILRLSAATTARNQDKISQCAGNLRQLGQCSLLYAADNSGKLPYNGGSYWASDLTISACDALMKRSATRNNFYDPGFPEDNADVNWHYTIGYRVTGYAYTFPGQAGVDAIYQNPTTSPFQPVGGGYTSPPTPASQRVLAADATMSHSTSRSGDSGNFTIFTENLNVIQRSPHLDGFVPAGCNVVMLDGHVEWRLFSQMSVRTTAGYPRFWW
jgi:prepilin-type processing-associated H-X9-DG protein